MVFVYKAKREIGFEVTGEAFQELTNWSHRIDEMVFKKQLATGKFRDNLPLDEDTLTSMRYVEKQGGILPYYGVSGSSGACIYRFRIIRPQVELAIEHAATGEATSFGAPMKRARRPRLAKGRRFKFSPFPFLIQEALPEEWSGKPPKSLVCRIFGREYEKLAKWPNWIDSQALSERYEFSFSQVSMGSTGFVAKIEDTKSGDVIDVTDYDDW